MQKPMEREQEIRSSRLDKFRIRNVPYSVYYEINVTQYHINSVREIVDEITISRISDGR